ncbi:uncharacterized protein LOC122505767 [Leptopilina heterotoma]|uniref:uncharacterized protein LOC122505767 n=1 Tax=Leptopilina heterotoma TaxID=63436 RepID=UPI001CA99445|nr:uncharacterized protein LOC122505767 [Leptopilina heterotoma]XP_043473520.1 uncharacterized protein LOC122505767 [Leptopilina heterotoma]XP_043473521.1 uncharacterized protein LOC122505767 [Leptopilina heterotoma]
MLRIAVICLLFSFVNSKNCTLSRDELKKLENTLSLALDFAKKNVDINENAIICVGSARAGKSTLINYLIGNPLKGESISKYESLKISKADNSPGPEIGQGPTSKTKEPTKYSMPKFRNTVVWDSPGFHDNRGESQDISNSFYIYQLLKTVKNLKIVVVVDYNILLTDTSSQMTSLLNSLENLFGNNFKHIFSSTSMVFSKVPYDKSNKESMELIKSKLQYNYIDSELSMSENAKNFLKYVVQHKESIAFFKSARKVGLINSKEIGYNIIESINASKILNKQLLQDVKPSMSESSRNCLSETLDIILLNPLYDHLESVTNEIIKIINDYDTQVKDSKQLNVIENKLKEIKSVLKKAKEVNNNLIEQFNFYTSINDKIKTRIENYDLVKKVELIDFLDNLLNVTKKKDTEILVNLKSSALIAQVDSVLSNIRLQYLKQNTADKQTELEDFRNKFEALKNISKFKNTTESQPEAITKEVFKPNLLVPVFSLVAFLIICFFLID